MHGYWGVQWIIYSGILVPPAQLQILQSCKKITTMKTYYYFFCRIRLWIDGCSLWLADVPSLWLRLNEMQILLYFFSNLFVSLLFTQDRNPKVLGLGPQGPECKLNPYWSKLRVREKHDVMLFSFFTCPLIPKTLLTQKSDSIFVHRLLRYSIFPHISLRFLFPFYKKTDVLVLDVVPYFSMDFHWKFMKFGTKD